MADKKSCDTCTKTPQEPKTQSTQHQTDKTINNATADQGDIAKSSKDQAELLKTTNFAETNKNASAGEFQNKTDTAVIHNPTNSNQYKKGEDINEKNMVTTAGK